jgi:HSP20 family molecular chaperone IbpA
MSTETLAIRKTESIFDTIERMNAQISRRAYEIFEGRGGNELENWLAAERELRWQPPIELREKDDEFVLKMAAAGLNPKDIEIEVTPESLVLKGEVRHEHREDTGTVHACEFECGTLFRAIHFPKRIDPAKMKAQLKNGMLHIKAPLASGKGNREASSDAA